LRAAAQDEEAAALAGIDIRKTTAIVSGIGMGLIAVAAVFASPFAAKPLWSPYMGWWVLIMAIAVVTLGGLGSLPGSVVGAFIIGYSEILISSAPGTFVLLGAVVHYSQFSVVVPLFVVLLVMIFRPEGLFGERKELEG
jgi:branched-chain amino acid transport system permease protein